MLGVHNDKGFKHLHKYETDSKGKSTCKCGRIVVSHLTDNLRDSTCEVLAVGDPNYSDPAPVIKPAEKFGVSLPPVPPKPIGDRAIGRYYDAHRLGIEGDIHIMGVKKGLERWGISSSTWNGLQKKWKRYEDQLRANPPSDKVSQVVPENIPAASRPAPAKLKENTNLSRLIKYWQDRLAKNQNSAEKVVMEMTVEYLEELAG